MKIFTSFNKIIFIKNIFIKVICNVGTFLCVTHSASEYKPDQFFKTGWRYDTEIKISVPSDDGTERFLMYHGALYAGNGGTNFFEILPHGPGSGNMVIQACGILYFRFAKWIRTDRLSSLSPFEETLLMWDSVLPLSLNEYYTNVSRSLIKNQQVRSVYAAAEKGVPGIVALIHNPQGILQFRQILDLQGTIISETEYLRGPGGVLTAVIYGNNKKKIAEIQYQNGLAQAIDKTKTDLLLNVYDDDGGNR